MKKYVAALLLVFVCSVNMAYSASRPEMQHKTKIPGSLSEAKVKTLCDKAREDQQRQMENLPSVTAAIVECYRTGEAENICETKFNSFGCYYGYLKEASARVKQHCN